MLMGESAQSFSTDFLLLPPPSSLLLFFLSPSSLLLPSFFSPSLPLFFLIYSPSLSFFFHVCVCACAHPHTHTPLPFSPETVMLTTPRTPVKFSFCSLANPNIFVLAWLCCSESWEGQLETELLQLWLQTEKSLIRIMLLSRDSKDRFKPLSALASYHWEFQISSHFNISGQILTQDKQKPSGYMIIPDKKCKDPSPGL